MSGMSLPPAVGLPPRTLRVGGMGPLRLSLPLLLAAATWSSAGGSPPSPPILGGPPPSDTLSSLPPNLSVTVSDPDADSLTVTFHGRPLPAAAGPDFTLIELPDTQYYTASVAGGSPAIFLAQTQWIVANRAIRNIAYVAHVGDLVQDGGNGGNPAEWMAADSCMRPLENPESMALPDGIPFGISAGNHDVDPNGLAFYNQYFGVSRFAGRGYYGGHFGTNNNHWFDLFSANGLDFIVIGIGLMWSPDPAVVQWADNLFTAYPNRRAIVVSHYLLDPGPPVTFSPQGQAIYDGLKSHSNLILMICGHYVEARRADTYNGHTIHTIMANYQSRGHGGDGWLRIMEFSPAHNQIRMRTYSPTLGQFEADADSSSQFAIDCDLSGGDGGFQTIGTSSRVPSGSTVSIPWAGLLHGKTYEWYVTVSDGSSTVTGPTWQLTTDDHIPPAVRVAAPNGGEGFAIGQRAQFRWNATDDASGMRSVDIALSRDGLAGPWQTLVSGFPNTGTLNWWVTGPATQSAWVRVVARDSFRNEALDASDGPFAIQATAAVGDRPAGELALEPVAPNPTRGPTRFGIQLPGAGRIRLDIVDVGGREVAVLADGFEPAGRREFAWNARTAHGRAPAGLYVARLQSSGRIVRRKFVIVR